MSILNVNQIQPVGSGQTVTISATNIDTGSATVNAGTFTGNLTGNVTGNATGLSGTPNLNVGILTASSFSGSGSALTGVGKILQVVQSTKTDTDSTSSTTYVDITGFNASITPSSTSNKILVQVVIGTIGNATVGRGTNFQLFRDSTAIAVGDNAVGGQCSFSNCEADSSYMGGGIQFTYLDSPATTSSITYKVQWLTWSNTVYLNRSSDGSQAQSWNRRGISQIILMEVAG